MKKEKKEKLKKEIFWFSLYIISFLIGLGFGYEAKAQSKTELDCLTENIYHESRGEPVEGQIAVAATTLNRLMSDRYPDTVCDVVYEKGQFSWTNMNKKIKKPKVYDRIKNEIAKPMLMGLLTHEYHDVTMFHADKVYLPEKDRWVTLRPYWSEHYEKFTQIGNHIFYK